MSDLCRFSSRVGRDKYGQSYHFLLNRISKGIPGRSTAYPALPPTDPDVKISLIRFLRMHKLYARALPDSSHPVWRITCCPLAFAIPEVSLTWSVVPEYHPSLPPEKRYACFHLPCSGSRGPWFPTLPDNCPSVL